MVFIVVQNVAGIDCVVLKICEFQFYARLAGKCLFTTFFSGVFGGKNGGKRKLCVFVSPQECKSPRNTHCEV